MIIGFGIYYVNDYSHSDSTALSYINGSENVSVTHSSNGLFIDGKGNDTALIFYPGAKVEYSAYLPLMNQIAAQGVDVYLVQMPFNLAFFGQNSADDIIKNSNYSHYIMSGHSLGGVAASGYASKHDVDGLVLLAAYPSEEIDKPTLSIYGSEDKVLNLKSYNDARPLIKANFTEHIINGGNHAQFGNYGLQKGDGNAGINATLQQNETASEIINFINKLF
ncbi:MAG: alpha/beta hydrolase [Methanobrevibacter sp.]|nr:alpha/beta hydrolase [Methanobrevibacter sp.]